MARWLLLLLMWAQGGCVRLGAGLIGGCVLIMTSPLLRRHCRDFGTSRWVFLVLPVHPPDRVELRLDVVDELQVDGRREDAEGAAGRAQTAAGGRSGVIGVKLKLVAHQDEQKPRDLLANLNKKRGEGARSKQRGNEKGMGRQLRGRGRTDGGK